MTITTFVFLLTEMNKFHLIWLAPFFIFISGAINHILFSIPIIGNLYLWIVILFARIITIGVKTDKTPGDYVDIMSQRL